MKVKGVSAKGCPSHKGVHYGFEAFTTPPGMKVGYASWREGKYIAISLNVNKRGIVIFKVPR